METEDIFRKKYAFFCGIPLYTEDVLFIIE
jgi:hypothetical protein